jgi:hypothetical protein
MRTLAESRWRDLLGLWVAALVLLMVINAVAGESLLSTTALIGFPLALAVLALMLTVAKRRAG